MHVQTQLLSDRLDVLQALLVVGTRTADPDLGLVLVEDRCDLAQGADHALESGGDVGEVGDTAADEEDLAVGVCGSAQHQVEDGAGVVVGLGLGRSARVFTIVGEFADEASRGNGVGVDDRGTAPRDKSPDAAIGIEDGEFEGGASLRVHVGDELLLLAHFATERSGEVHWRTRVDGDSPVGLGSSGQTEGGRAAGDGPFGTALEFSRLVDLGGKVEEMDLGGGGLGVGDDHERVDFEVGELAVDVDGVETGDEIDEDIVNALGHVLQQRRGNLVVGGVVFQVDRDEKLLSFGVDIADIDTTLVGEEDPVTLASQSKAMELDNQHTSRTELMLM